MSNTANSRVERPTLQGQRIKTRKRDEKEKHDPNGFRDSILTAINEIIAVSSPKNGTASSSSSILKNSASNNSSVSSVSEKGINNCLSSDKTSLDQESLPSSPTLSPEHKAVVVERETEETPEGNAVVAAEPSPALTVVPNGSATLVSSSDFVTKSRLEALSKFLDERGSKGKDDYRKYGEVLFDVLIAGGILGEFQQSR